MSRQPPSWPFKILRGICNPLIYEEIEGDLLELYYEREANFGRAKANFYLIIDLVKSLNFHRSRRAHHRAINSTGMISNYLKVAVRHLVKHRWYSLLNLTGSVLGISTFLVISLYVNFHFSFDQSFNDADRIYRVAGEAQLNDMNAHMKYTSLGLGKMIMESVPEIEIASSMAKGFYNYQFSSNENKVYEKKVFYTDPEFLRIFQLNAIHGEPADAISQPGTIILTESVAQELFGTSNPVGEVISASSGDSQHELTVGGVIEDLPKNSHFNFFEMLVSVSTYETIGRVTKDPQNVNSFTYFRKRVNAEEEVVNEKMNMALKAVAGEDFWHTLYAQPLTDIHLNQRGYGVGADADIRTLYIFSLVALLVLLVACINYVNLTTAQAAVRFKEMGVRTVMGSRRTHIFFQIVAESAFFILASFLISIVVMIVILPAFNVSFGTSLDATTLLDGKVIIAMLLVVIAIGLATGLYPAYFLTRRSSILLLKAKDDAGRKSVFRRGLVTVQFMISFGIVLSAVVINQQLQFMADKDLGFEKENVLYINLQTATNAKNYNLLKREFAKVPQVLTVAGTAGSNIDEGIGGNGIEMEGSEEVMMRRVMLVDYELQDVLGFKLSEGRWFSRQHATDSGAAFVINQALAKELGDGALGMNLLRNGQKGKVIGIVEDFHTQSLHKPIKPLLMFMSTGDILYGSYPNLVLRVSGDNLQETIARLESKWNQLSDGRPFDFNFLDDELDSQYREEAVFSKLFNGFSSLALVVSSLGLLGLISFAVERRAKEIGIRKVLGASVRSILMLISKEFVLLTVVALVIALPLTVIYLNSWLENFAYHIDVAAFAVVQAIAITVVVSLATVSFRSLSAARSNPVDSLRDE